LLAQAGAQLRVRGQLLAPGQADQHRQWGLQGVAQVAQGVARALQGVLGVSQQVVDLRHQRLQLLRHLRIQIAAAALLQLHDLLADLLQRAQCAAHGITLSQQHQQQRGAAQPEPDPLHVAEALQYRLVVLGHADRQVLAITAVVGTVDQQQLALRAVGQFGLHTRAAWLEQLAVPQRARTPAAVGEVDAKVVPGKLPLERWIEAPLVQLQT